MSKLTPELQKQIEQEAEQLYSKLDELARDQDSYDFGLPMFKKEKQPIIDKLSEYAEKWQEAEQKAERYEKALKEIQAKAKNGIFPHLPVETMGAQMCIEIDQYITDLFTPNQTTDE